MMVQVFKNQSESHSLMIRGYGLTIFVFFKGWDGHPISPEQMQGIGRDKSVQMICALRQYRDNNKAKRGSGHYVIRHPPCFAEKGEYAEKKALRNKCHFNPDHHHTKNLSAQQTRHYRAETVKQTGIEHEKEAGQQKCPVQFSMNLMGIEKRQCVE